MTRACVWGYLEAVRERPGMYIGDPPNPLDVLELLLGGYYTALSCHAIHEPGPQLTQGHFGIWLRWRTRWSLSCGWARAIQEHSKPGMHLQRFFALADEYSKLVPVVRARAAAGRKKFEIVRYAPTPLHFVRTRVGVRIDDDWILMTETGSHEVTLAQAKRLANKRLALPELKWKTLRS